MQIVCKFLKKLRFLSARPKHYNGIKHHLYGFLSVKKNFSTGEWLRLVEKKSFRLLGKKKYQ